MMSISLSGSEPRFSISIVSLIACGSDVYGRDRDGTSSLVGSVSNTSFIDKRGPCSASYSVLWVEIG